MFAFPALFSPLSIYHYLTCHKFLCILSCLSAVPASESYVIVKRTLIKKKIFYFVLDYTQLRGSLGSQTVKDLPAMQETQFHLWVEKIPWRREWQPTLVFLPGESHGQKSLAAYSPQGRKESEMTVTNTQKHSQVTNNIVIVLGKQ